MIKGRQFLDVSEVLTSFQGEEFVRTRIGRLYYGTWLEARSYCEAHLGYKREKMAREHRVVASLLGSIDPTLEYELRVLRDVRNQADYDDHLSSEQVDNLLLTADASTGRILALLDQLRKGT